jgi:hypothetical protein
MSVSIHPARIRGELVRRRTWVEIPIGSAPIPLREWMRNTPARNWSTMAERSRRNGWLFLLLLPLLVGWFWCRHQEPDDAEEPEVTEERSLLPPSPPSAEPVAKP